MDIREFFYKIKRFFYDHRIFRSCIRLFLNRLDHEKSDPAYLMQSGTGIFLAKSFF